MSTRTQFDRDRVLRTLTFWLRPAFVLRTLNRFQRIAGFDRAVALASSALTALIPLAILAGAILPRLGGKDAADRIIDRYDLTGGGAEAVKDAFSPAAGTETERQRGRRAAARGRGAELLAGRAAAVRADLGAQAAQRAQHGQRAALDRRAHAVHDAERLDPRRHRPDPPPDRREPRAHPRVGRVPGVERMDPDRQAHLPEDPAAVRRHGSGPARGVLHGRGGVRAAPVRVLRHTLRGDRRGLRDDLRAVLRDGRRRRVRGARARGRRRAGAHPQGRAARPTTRSGSEWDAVIAETRSRWAVLREQIDRRRGKAAS